MWGQSLHSFWGSRLHAFWGFVSSPGGQGDGIWGLVALPFPHAMVALSFPPALDDPGGVPKACRSACPLTRPWVQLCRLPCAAALLVVSWLFPCYL